MAKKLLIDHFGFIKPVLVEDHGKMVMRGEFGRCDVPTENKRIYPRAIWEREVAKVQNPIAEGKVLGELDHPSDGKTSLKRVSHRITKLEIQPDGRVTGEATIMDNEYGRQLKSILDVGGSVGVSSRGMGSTAMNEDGYEVVQDDYSYIVHDCVADPAVKTSYPEFSTESKEIKKETVMETKVESKKEETKPELKTEAQAGAPAAVVAEEKKPEVKVGTPIEQLGEEMKDRLAAQKKDLEEGFSKTLEAKVAEAKEALKKELEADPKALAGKIVVEDVAKLLRPFLLPEDVQEVVKAKDKEIADLTAAKTQLAEEKKKLTKLAHDFAMLYHFSNSLVEGDDRKAVRGIIGDPRKYAKHQDLTEAVTAAKDALKKVIDEKTTNPKIEAEKADLQKKLDEANAEKDKLKSALKETAEIARKTALEAYVHKRVKGNPNAEKIIKLCEDVATKQAADQLIEKFNVAAPFSREYNSIRNRFKKVENSSLVEDQLKETGVKNNSESKSEVVSEGVDKEMDGILLGSSLEQVRDLAGLN